MSVYKGCYSRFYCISMNCNRYNDIVIIINTLYFQVCVICGDPFEQFWDEEAEEWHLRDAIRSEKKVCTYVYC